MKMIAIHTLLDRWVGSWFTRLLAVVILIGARGDLAAQTGRYEGTTEAREAFTRGQGHAADGDRYLQQGDTDRAFRSFDEAEEAYRQALEYDPEYLDAVERLAYVLYVMGRSEEAVEALRNALSDHPAELALRRMLGINLYELGRTEEAIALLQEVDQQGGATADVTFILAKHAYELENYQESIPYFRRYLVDNPSDAAGHGALGNAYLRTAQHDLALAEFRTVIELDPDNLTARINIGEAYFASQDWERAINVYQYVVERDPENVRLWFNLGKCLFEEARYDEALEAFQNMTRLRPDLYQGHYFMGAALVELERYQQARDSLELAIAAGPDHALSHYRLGLAESHLDHLDAAAEALETAIQLDSDEPWFWLALGDVRRRQGRLDEALDLHLRAIEADGTQAVFHESLGRDCYAQNRIDDAIASLEQALTLELDRTSARQALSVALLTRFDQAIEGERLDEARIDLDRARELAAHPFDLALAGATLSLSSFEVAAAETALQAVSEEDREDPRFRRVVAQLHLLQGEPGEIGSLLHDLRLAIATTLDPRDAALLGHAAAREDSWERALELFERAAQQDTRYQSAVALSHFRLGLQLAQRGRWQEADEQFRRAENQIDTVTRQDAVRIRYALGIASLHLGNWGRAERSLTDARRQLNALSGAERSRLPRRDADLDIDAQLGYALYRDRNYEEAVDRLNALPADARGGDVQDLIVSAHEHLAWRALEADNPSSARAHFEAALAQSPENPITRNNYACLLYSNGETAEAGRLFEALAEDGSVTNALYNYAIYLDEVADDPEGAYRYYSRYIERDGEAADQARQLARIKQEVFGFEPQ